MLRLKQLRTAPLLMRRATAALPVRRFLGTTAQPHKPAEHGHGEQHDAHDHGHDSHGHGGKLDKIAEKLEGPFGKMDKALDKVYGGLWGLTGPALKFVGKTAATAGNGAFNVLRESTGVFASRQQRQGISDASAFDLGAIPPNDPREINEKPQVTVLPNGIRVVSVESHNPILSIGAYFDAGSRYETRESNGFTQLIPEVAYLSTRNRSAFKMTRDASKIGATFDCISGREHVLFAAHGFPANAEELIGTLADVILEPKLAENEVEEAAAALEEKSAGIFDEPSVWIAESMHEAAFLKNSLGVRYYTPLSNLRMNMVDGLAEYYTYLFTPKRLTVSGVGIEHSKLVALTKEAFANLSEPEEVVQREPAQYTGGELRLHKKGDDLTHFALGFRGASWRDPDVVPLGVLQAILNGSGSGRPSRHTGIGGGQSIARLSRLVDNADGLLAATSFVNTYSDAGLFALYGTAEPGQAGKVVDAMIKEAHALAGPVEASELKAAKAQLKNVILGGGSRTDQLDDIARQVVNTGSARTPSELCALVDRVSENDISKAAKKLLNSPPSVVALGNLAFVPQYDTIASRFK